MLSFSDSSFTITVKCAGNPVDQFIETYTELLDLLHSEDEELKSRRTMTINLLKEMLPHYKQIKH